MVPQQVKETQGSSHYLQAPLFRVLVPDQAVQLPIQLPPNNPDKAAEDGPRACSSATHWRNQMEFLTVDFNLT